VSIGEFRFGSSGDMAEAVGDQSEPMAGASALRPGSSGGANWRRCCDDKGFSTFGVDIILSNWILLIFIDYWLCWAEF
jgi:hypothetical protein